MSDVKKELVGARVVEIGRLVADMDVLVGEMKGVLGVPVSRSVDVAGVDVSPDVVGANLMRLRNPVCSQMKLAVMMRADGFNWSAATVWAIESGRRHLRFAEAVRVLVNLGYGAGSLGELCAPVDGKGVGDVTRDC